MILLHSEDMWRNTGPDQFNSPRRSSYAAVCEASETWTSWSAVGDIPSAAGCDLHRTTLLLARPSQR